MCNHASNMTVGKQTIADYLKSNLQSEMFCRYEYHYIAVSTEYL